MKLKIPNASELVIPIRKEENKSVLTLNEIQMQMDLANTNPHPNNDSS